MSTTEANTSVITSSTLSLFSGSLNFYRHPIARNVIMTEGCDFLCSHGAAWLIDEIALVQNVKTIAEEAFQSWKLVVNLEDGTADLIATDGGSGVDAEGKPVYKELFWKRIPYTDFPLKSVSLYCCPNGEGRSGRTIMLAGEY